LTDFWNKWHISLSTWLRDYLFLPIAYFMLKLTKKNKIINIKIEEWAYVGGITITMFLGGLWHGASWTFVIWGLIHGAYLALGRLLKKVKKKSLRTLGIRRHSIFHKALSVIFVFHLVTFAWIFFRSPSFEHSINYLSNLNFKMSGSGFIHLLYTLGFAVLFFLLEILVKDKKRIKFIKKFPVEFKIAFYVIFVTFIMLFSIDKSNGFIYFQF